MKEYLNMWKNYVNFSDRTTVSGYWMAFLFNFLAGIVLGVLVQIIPVFSYVSYVYSLAVFLPNLALIVRRLRDAGKSWTNIFWLFLPIAGVIIFIILLCKPSKAHDGTPVV